VYAVDVKTITIPEETPTVKVKDIRIVVECEKCHNVWAFYLSKCGPLSMICMPCMAASVNPDKQCEISHNLAQGE
jgi:hypothetical protein